MSQRRGYQEGILSLQMTTAICFSLNNYAWRNVNKDNLFFDGPWNDVMNLSPILQKILHKTPKIMLF